MTPYQIHKAVEKFITDNWTYTPIKSANKPFTPTLPYIEPHLKTGNVTGIEIKGVNVRTGVIMINIFIPKNVGIEQGLSYASLLESLFDHHVIVTDDGRIFCDNDFMMPRTENIGFDSVIQAFQIQVIIPFSIIY